jgi:membrane protein
LLIASSGVFVQLRRGLNEIWGVEPPPEKFSRFIRARLTSLGVVAALGLMLMISLTFDALITAFSELVNAYLAFGTLFLRAVNVVVSFLLTAALFAAMYAILTIRKVELRHALAGALVTAVLFQLGRVVIGTYLGSSSIVSSFGAAGALIALLFWVYYSALIVFFGAALTREFVTTGRGENHDAAPVANRTAGVNASSESTIP